MDDKQERFEQLAKEIIQKKSEITDFIKQDKFYKAR